MRTDRDFWTISPQVWHFCEVKRVAATTQNLLPVLIDAARTRCTVGELVNALADVYGRYNGAAKW